MAYKNYMKMYEYKLVSKKVLSRYTTLTDKTLTNVVPSF